MENTAKIELVVSDNKVYATSREVAENFGKRHDNVLQSIAALECTKEFIDLNFQLSKYSVDLGHATRDYPEYHMTKDGFILLVMGFNGKKAVVIKQAYIAKFNEMEGRLYDAFAETGNPKFDPESLTTTKMFKMALAVMEEHDTRLNEQARHLQLVTEETKAVATANKEAVDSSRLSADQIKAAEFALLEKLAHLPYNVRNKIRGKIYNMIKRECLETPYITNMTWKDVPQKNFEQLMTVVGNYELPRWG